MGVHGLWRLIEPSGKPVPLETLENKVLAVDISIWLHQAVKGFQDSRGAPVPNAHLLGIYHRVCKLLYFRIKPVFVFDGGVPALKKQTIAKRTQSKLKNVAQADKIQRQLLSTLLKHSAVSKVLTEKIEASIGSIAKASTKQSKDDLYALPPTGELDSTFSSSDDESQSDTTCDSSPTKNWELHTIDMDSAHFKSLPVDVRHEILTDLKETRKQSSWGRLHELPKVSDDFSVYQLSRLRKRQAVQAALEEAEKEMGGKSLSLAELETLLKGQGVINNEDIGSRIASDETTKYLLVKDVKKAMEEARTCDLESKTKMLEGSKDNPIAIEDDKTLIKTQAEIEYDDDLQRAIALSLECEPSTSAGPDEASASSQTTIKAKTNPAEVSFLDNFADADFASSSSDEEPPVAKIAESKMSSAESYMLEYSGLTPSEIAKIMNKKSSVSDLKKSKAKKQILPAIIEYPTEIAKPTLKLDVKKIQIATLDTVNEQNTSERANDTVEIMSSTDSSDGEMDEKIKIKQGIDIVINPNRPFVDDLFSDVFQEAGKSSSAENKKDSHISSSKSQKALNIDINKEDNKDDDLFGDILSHNDVNSDISQISQVKDNENDVKKSLEIVVQRTEPFNKEDDLFYDVFVEDKTGPCKEIGKNAVVGIEIGSDALIKSQNKKQVDETKSVAVDTRDEKDQQDKEQNEKTSDIAQVSQIVNKSGSSKDNVENSDNLDIEESKNRDKERMTEQELLKLKNQLQKEKVDLINERSSKERTAGNITDQMYQEAQELLELFGVPYIIAPMEAEAQCAFLDEIELTDGTITDDSDIWLFGGKTVYKNFFNQSKYVMEFRADSIKHHFKLTREQMILLALLVGSDYTAGLQGVGPVTAVEILAAFPPSKGKINEFSLLHADLLSGLKEFRSWFSKGKSPGPGRNALKGKLKNLTFTENFPSLQVAEAYLEPSVETSTEAFSWSKPNTLALIEFAREKFGWTRNKTEDILNPVLKRLEESRHQKSIRDYFKTRFKVDSGEATSKMSKRVKSAITNMGRDPSEIISEELEEELKKEPKKKRPQRKKKEGAQAPEFTEKKTNSKTENENLYVDTGAKDDDSDKDFSENAKDKNKKKTNKINLKSLKSKAVNQDNETPSTSQTTKNMNSKADKRDAEDKDVDISEKIDHRKRRQLNEAKALADVKKPRARKEKPKKANQVQEDIPKGLKEDDDISEKIDHIRKRRQLKEAKALVDIKKPRVRKEKPKIAANQLQEDIPEGLQEDEEVNLLSQIAIHSSLKVEEINKSLQDQLENLRAHSVQIQKPGPSHETPSGSSRATASVRRPISRPTRVPRKELIPQKEKDKSAVLRNKLKAIEVFRKGKHGPGYVPKKDRKKRLPKAEAELSESSD